MVKIILMFENSFLKIEINCLKTISMYVSNRNNFKWKNKYQKKSYNEQTEPQINVR